MLICSMVSIEYNEQLPTNYKKNAMELLFITLCAQPVYSSKELNRTWHFVNMLQV